MGERIRSHITNTVWFIDCLSGLLNGVLYHTHSDTHNQTIQSYYIYMQFYSTDSIIFNIFPSLFLPNLFLSFHFVFIWVGFFAFLLCFLYASMIFKWTQQKQQLLWIKLQMALYLFQQMRVRKRKASSLFQQQWILFVSSTIAVDFKPKIITIATLLYTTGVAKTQNKEFFQLFGLVFVCKTKTGTFSCFFMELLHDKMKLRSLWNQRHILCQLRNHGLSFSHSHLHMICALFFSSSFSRFYDFQ